MELNDVKNFISENKDNEELKKYLSETISVDKELIAKEYLASRDGVRLIQSEADKMSAKAIDTFKKNFEEKEKPRLVSEEYNKKHPPETAEQKRIRELELKFENSENDKKRESLKLKMAQILNSKKLPLDFSDFIFVSDESEIEDKISKLENLFKAAVNYDVESRFKNSGHEPAKSNNKSDNLITTREQLRGLSNSEIVKLMNEGKIKIPGNDLSAFKTN